MLERKDTQVVQFLMKLKPNFEPIRGSIFKKLFQISMLFWRTHSYRDVHQYSAFVDLFYIIDVDMYTSKGTHKPYKQSLL